MPVALYDPLAPDYSDPAALRGELDRTYQKCSDCRLCVRLCPSFKSLFQMIDAYDDGATDVRVLTDAEQTRVVDECFQCKLCYVVCPYTPEKGSDWKIDFPGLMLRALLTKTVTKKASTSARLLARTDLQGKVATKVAPIVNATNKVAVLRTVMEKATGISRERLLPTFTRQRFSKWFDRRTPAAAGAGVPARGTVALFPTCMVEYQNTTVGKAVVGVYEHNGIACTLPEGQVCCGMPWLDAGDREKFEEHAKRNVEVLADAVRGGADIVVTQPTCGYVLKHEYPNFLQTDDARLVGEHSFDVSEYLIARHREQPIDTEFTGSTYASITWHAACHQRAQQIGPKSRDVMALTGATVTIVERCAGIDGTWGLRAENVAMAKQVAKPLMETVRGSDADLIAGDCHLANNAIIEETGKTPQHPFEVIARAYGIDLES